MKIACVILNNNLIKTDEQNEILHDIQKQFFEIGEDVSLISYFDNNFENIKSIFEKGFDRMFFIGTTSPIYNYNIKQNLCRLVGDTLDNNAICHTVLHNYCSNNNIVFSVQEDMEIKLPISALPIACDKFYNTGFVINRNNFQLTFLPGDIDFYRYITCNNIYILIPQNNSNYETIVLKCYGIFEKDIRAALTEEFSNPNITIQILSKSLDNAIYIRYSISDSTSAREVVSSICTKLHKFIYSTEDMDLFKMANTLLSIQKKKISIAETLSLGEITSSLNCNNFCNVLDSYVFTNFDSLLRTFNLDKKIIETYGPLSVNTVYELDNLLLEKSCADIALFILGNKDSDTFFIAIGDFDGIHVYKNKISANNKNLRESIAQTAIFYLIKKLRQNDLQFK